MSSGFLQFIQFELSTAYVIGLAAFCIHLVAYIWYSVEFFKGRLHLNIASWFIWFAGALIEYITYDAIDSHFSTSAVPLACLVGVVYMGCVVFFLHIRRSIMGIRKYYYVEIEITDLILILIGVLAYAFFVTTDNAALANIIIVSSSILSFIPIWKSILENGNEHPGPWVVWCFPYILMIIAVFLEGGEHLFVQSYYPIYFFVLHVIVALLAIKSVRSKVKAFYYTMVYRRYRSRKRGTKHYG